MSADNARPHTSVSTSRRVLLGTVAVLAAASLSACAGMVPGSAVPATGAGGATAATAATAVDAKTWTNQVCGAFLKLKTLESKQPDLDTSSPKAAISGLAKFLDGLADGVDSVVAELKGIGPGPDANADTFMKTMIDGLNAESAAVQKAKSVVEQTDPSNPTALEKAMEPLNAVDAQLPDFDKLDASPAVDAAAATAPNCQELQKTS